MRESPRAFGGCAAACRRAQPGPAHTPMEDASRRQHGRVHAPASGVGGGARRSLAWRWVRPAAPHTIVALTAPPRKRIRGAAFGGAHCLGACFEQGAFAPQPRGRRRRSLPHSSGPRGTPNLCAAARQCRRCQVAGPRPQARDPAASTRRQGQRCVAGSPPLVSGASGAATGDGSVRRAPQEGTGGPPACHLLKHFHSHTPLRPQSPVNRPVQA